MELSNLISILNKIYIKHGNEYKPKISTDMGYINMNFVQVDKQYKTIEFSYYEGIHYENVEIYGQNGAELKGK